MKSNQTPNKIVSSDPLRLAIHFRSITKECALLMTRTSCYIIHSRVLNLCVAYTSKNVFIRVQERPAYILKTKTPWP